MELMQPNIVHRDRSEFLSQTITEGSKAAIQLDDAGLESFGLDACEISGAAAKKHYLTLQGPGIDQTTLLESATYSIGRYIGNSIVINNDSVSGQHAILLRLNGLPQERLAFRIIDGNLQGKRSRNGLWINGIRCYSHDLQDQDIIHLGPDIQAVYYCVDPSALEDDSDPTTVSSRRPSKKDTAAELQMAGDQALVRLSSFIELIPYPIFELNLSGKMTYLNPAAITQFPDLKENTQHPLLDNLLSLGLSHPQKHQVREVQVGELIYEQFIHYLIESDLIRCYLVDITQRIQAEQHLIESEDRYAAAAAGANDGLWDWNLTTNQIYFSPRWKAMLGYDEAEIGDRPDEWFGRLDPSDKSEVQNQLALHLSSATAQFQTEFRLLTRLGEYRWFRCRGLARRNEAGEPYRVSGSLMDITDQYVMKQELLNILRTALKPY
jgi:PAS domain S-box-containing protein